MNGRPKNSILVTGGSGFIGSSVIRCLNERGTQVIPVSKRGLAGTIPKDLTSNESWCELLEPVDCIIHTAARVHVMSETSLDALAAYRYVNVSGTLNLARQAAKIGVRRFVFLSSVKVNGERMLSQGRPLSEVDTPLPQEPYGISKLEAEIGLFRLAEEYGMEVVVVRPPLVYGPGVKANFQAMMDWLIKGFPLPLGSLNNRRSMVGLGNLVDILLKCVEHPNAANQTFFVSDGVDVTTTDLLRRLGEALMHPARLIPIPSWIIEKGALAIGKQDIATRLCGSLQVDISKARSLLGWDPPITIDDELLRTARHFLDQKRYAPLCNPV